MSENKKMQRTIGGELSKSIEINDGDLIEIAGKEYVYEYGVLQMSDGVMPEPKIKELIRIGKAVIK